MDDSKPEGQELVPADEVAGPDWLKRQDVKKALAKLPTKKAAFVVGVCSGKNNTDALLDAGWAVARKSASAMASKILKEDAEVQEAVAVIKAAIVEASAYDREEYVRELNDAMKLAKDWRNGNALAKLLEIKGKAHGLIIDKGENKNLNAGFSIQITGVEQKPQ